MHSAVVLCECAGGLACNKYVHFSPVLTHAVSSVWNIESKFKPPLKDFESDVKCNSMTSLSIPSPAFQRKQIRGLVFNQLGM